MAEVYVSDIRPGDKIRTQDGSTHEVSMQVVGDGYYRLHTTCGCGPFVYSPTETVEKVQ